VQEENLGSTRKSQMVDTRNLKIVVPPAHTQKVYFSICSSVCPSVIYENTLNFQKKELKSGCPRGVFCPSSIPSEYLFLCTRRKFGFNKKISRDLLIPPAGYL
jgi:hypothetical protein